MFLQYCPQQSKNVENIKEWNGNDLLTVFTNGGPKHFYHESDINLLPLQVNYNKESMDNITAFKDTENINGSRITMEDAKERAIIVSLRNINCFKFKECASGLY